MLAPAPVMFWRALTKTGSWSVRLRAESPRRVSLSILGGSHFNYGYLWYPDQQVMVMFDVGYIPASEHEGEPTDDKMRERMGSFLDQYPEV